MADNQDKGLYGRLFPVPPPTAPQGLAGEGEAEDLGPEMSEQESESGADIGGEEVVSEIVRPPAPEEQDDMKDLFEGPKKTDRDMAFDDLVSAGDDEEDDDFSDLTSLSDSDMDDLFGVDRSDVLGRAPRKKTNRVHRSPRPPTSMSGMI